jgi:nitrogen-specific signal transduction histidine kinase
MKFSFGLENRADSAVLCRLAHDLTNNLSVILGRCQLLEEVLRGNVEAEKHLRLIIEETRRMAERIATRPCNFSDGQYEFKSRESSQIVEGGARGAFETLNPHLPQKRFRTR